MSKVADQLREYAENVRRYHGTDIHGKEREYVTVTTADMLKLADQIDREHERRMEQQRREMRRAFCCYIGGVLNDYKHGIKRKRK